MPDDPSTDDDTDVTAILEEIDPDEPDTAEPDADTAYPDLPGRDHGMDPESAKFFWLERAATWEATAPKVARRTRARAMTWCVPYDGPGFASEKGGGYDLGFALLHWHARRSEAASDSLTELFRQADAIGHRLLGSRTGTESVTGAIGVPWVAARLVAERVRTDLETVHGDEHGADEVAAFIRVLWTTPYRVVRWPDEALPAAMRMHRYFTGIGRPAGGQPARGVRELVKIGTCTKSETLRRSSTFSGSRLNLRSSSDLGLCSFPRISGGAPMTVQIPLLTRSDLRARARAHYPRVTRATRLARVRHNQADAAGPGVEEHRNGGRR
jgi:hypothetical protein